MRSGLTSAFVALAVALALAATPVRADSIDEVRRVFADFIGAQNTHDVDGVRRLLSDSPDFLWAIAGRVVRDRDAALDDLRESFKGPWKIEADVSTLEVLGLDASTFEVSVRVAIHGSAPARKAQMNLMLVDTPYGWRVLSIVVSDAPPEPDVRDEPPGPAPATSRIALR